MQEMADRPFEAYADNTLSGGFVVGEAVADWRSIDFSKMRHVARAGDKVVGEAVGGHPAVNPFILVFVGANTARERHGIQTGQIPATLSPYAQLTAEPTADNRTHFHDLGSW